MTGPVRSGAMTILFIGPLPPPVTGHSLACQVLLDDLVRDHQVKIVNLTGQTLIQGVFGAGRIREVLAILRAIWRRRRNNDAIYLTISESFAGNLKDLCIYAICAGSLPRIYIHLHGGSIRTLLWDRHYLVFLANKLFLRRVAGAIVTGRSHLGMFDGVIEPDRVHVVTNFAQEYLFATEEEIRHKFSRAQPQLRVLFMSNFQPEKGFNELVDAYMGLAPALKARLRVDFAGRFESRAEEQVFREKIGGTDQLEYHGVVDGAAKKRLFSAAHLFCLPTSLLEGQPISILEAYASGCVVLTTGKGGIRDIFTPGVNGFEVQERSASSIAAMLEHALAGADRLVDIALANRALADEKFRTSTYNTSMRRILESRRAGESTGPAVPRERLAGRGVNSPW